MNFNRGAVADNDAWKDFAPAYSSDIGNAAATFTGGGSVTTNQARAQIWGKQGWLAIQGTGVLLVVTPAYIKLSLPAGFVPQNSSNLMSCPIKVGATWETGQVRVDTTGIYFYRANRAAFTASATLIWACNLPIELT